MTDLLPIVFSRGQNEGVDPRVAPLDAHAIARNVRWRKDGRPAKKYGVTALTTTGLAAGQFNTQPANVLTQWNRTPVIAVGSRVAQLSALGWSAQRQVDDSELSHFGPGERELVARDESSAIANPTSGTAGGVILHVWDNGTGLYYSVKGVNGEVIVTPRFLINGTEPRCISTTNFIYVLSKNGVALDLRVFDPTTLAFTAGGSPGNLDAAGSHFDACGRGTDFLVAYQSAAAVITVKSFTAVLVPVLVQTQTAFAAASGAYVGVIGNSTSSIFLAVMNTPGSGGTLGFAVWNNALTVNTGGAVPDADPNNIGQPGLVLQTNTTAVVVWGGFVVASESSYMRACQLTSVGGFGAVGTFYGVSPASKPFMGPVYALLNAESDGQYVWVATHNASNGSQKWDTQRAYYLVKFHANATTPLRRQMHVPNSIPSAGTHLHLSDVLALGTGYGFMVPLLNALRFGNGQTAIFGFDTVTARSIFESTAMAVRDTSMAGRVLQFSGGSLFELNGAAEETGFSNFPVIQSATVGGAGGLTAGATYIYKAVYEWLDAQGRRHQSAPSDPVTVAMGAGTSVALTIKPLIADAHTLSASGSIAGRGVVIHVYRTLANQSTFHRVTPNFAPPMGSVVGAATVAFNDIVSDATASGSEFIYTDGGVAENTLCPPHTFQAVCNGRLWVGGGLDPCVLTASKLLVDGEPSQFSDLDVFNVFLPQKCTGLASIDGTIVAFASNRIFLVTGDGPNDQGIGSFNPPTELPTDVGCIDWRSVVETSIGVFFLSKRGIYLLPRGFSAPVFVGAEVESTLAGFPRIVNATLVCIPSNSVAGLDSTGEITVRFVFGADDVPTTTAVFVYDLRTGGWSVDDLTSGGPLLSGTWSDSFIMSSNSAGALTLYGENASSGYATIGNQFIQTTLGTGDIRPFGIAGYGEFKRVVLMGEFRAACTVFILVYVDGIQSAYSIDVTTQDASDGTVYLDITPQKCLGSSIRVTCTDTGFPGSAFVSEGMIMQALFIETELIGRTKRLAAARKA